MKKLDEITDRNPFKVPDNYFEEVNSKIISATAGSENGTKKSGLYARLRPYFLIAASVAGFILISYATIKVFMPDKSDSQVSIAFNTSDFDSYINDIDVNSLEENTASLILSDEKPEMNQTEIIDYLLDENIDLSDIYERL
jgi:hypothetical protein